MKNKNVQIIVENYYKASNALMNIGTLEDIPKELKTICLNATSATLKIINYVNEHKEGLYEKKNICVGRKYKVKGEYSKIIVTHICEDDTVGVIFEDDGLECQIDVDDLEEI